MNRRGFLQAILAAGVAPAFVGSSILMPVKKLVLPREFPGVGDTVLMRMVPEITVVEYRIGMQLQYEAPKPIELGVVLTDERMVDAYKSGALEVFSEGARYYSPRGES